LVIIQSAFFAFRIGAIGAMLTDMGFCFAVVHVARFFWLATTEFLFWRADLPSQALS
jgi:hypothetical protein